MDMPDCYDPVYQEERRQRKWDEHCVSALACSYCGSSVYLYPTYTKIGDLIYCQRCVSRGTFFSDEIEAETEIGTNFHT